MVIDLGVQDLRYLKLGFIINQDWGCGRLDMIRYWVLCDGCTVPLVYNSGWVRSVLDVGFSLCTVPTSYCSPDISYMMWISDPRVLSR